MPRFLLALVAFAALAVSASAAEPIAIDLEVRCGKASKTAHAEPAAVGLGDEPKARGVLEIKAGDKVMVHWKLHGTDPKVKIEDVTVHFVAVKEEMVGQPAVPKLDKGVIAETAQTLDFGGDDKNEGELTFIVEAPGAYLFRVETVGAAAGAPGHEDFAALDVQAR